ncbi:hypothetical protein C7B61_09775 [filamentous cyanobacterium CCP1]|nr:hypothetical protein C7B76_27750 [filamentous cyanobacterium CCP2]PSB66747.1 hypothetical protein C7B61_09775 [filamentous cyanobacterium CCP1]
MTTDKVRMTIYLPEELKDRLSAMAQQDKRSVTTMIEILLLEALEARGNKRANG